MHAPLRVLGLQCSRVAKAKKSPETREEFQVEECTLYTAVQTAPGKFAYIRDCSCVMSPQRIVGIHLVNAAKLLFR